MAFLAGEFDATHALTATALGIEFVELCPFTEPCLGHEENRSVITGNIT